MTLRLSRYGYFILWAKMHITDYFQLIMIHSTTFIKDQIGSYLHRSEVFRRLLRFAEKYSCEASRTSRQIEIKGDKTESIYK